MEANSKEPGIRGAFPQYGPDIASATIGSSKASIDAARAKQEGDGRAIEPEEKIGVPEDRESADAPAAKEATGAALSKVVSSEYPRPLKLVIILVAVALSLFLVALDTTIIGTAIPRITDEFHSIDDVGWYGSAFFLTVAGFQATWGKAYKYFPLKTVFIVSIFWFEIGSLICGVAKNSTTLIVGRAIAGVGGAGIASGAYTMMNFSAPPDKVPALTGVLGAVFSVASVVGPLLGGVFSNFNWRWSFYINLPIGGVSAALIIAFFTAPKKAKPVEAPLKEKLLQMDFPGTFVLIAAIVCLILALQWGGVTKSWGSADVIGTLVGFVLILGLFSVIEIFQRDRAMMSRRLMKQRTIYLLSFFQITGFGGFLVLLYYLPIYFQVVTGVSPANSGVRNLPLILSASFLTIFSGVVIAVTGHYIEMMIIGAVFSTVGCGLLYTLGLHSGHSHWIGYQIVAGIGYGLITQIPIIVGQAISKPEDISSITAIFIFLQTLGGSVWVSIAQSLFTNKLIKTVPSTAPGVNPKAVVATGATELRKTFPPSQITGVLISYLAGLKDAWILGIALAGTATLAAFVVLVLDWRVLPRGAALKPVESNRQEA